MTFVNETGFLPPSVSTSHESFVKHYEKPASSAQLPVQYQASRGIAYSTDYSRAFGSLPTVTRNRPPTLASVTLDYSALKLIGSSEESSSVPQVKPVAELNTRHSTYQDSYVGFEADTLDHLRSKNARKVERSYLLPLCGTVPRKSVSQTDFPQLAKVDPEQHVIHRCQGSSVHPKKHTKPVSVFPEEEEESAKMINRKYAKHASDGIFVGPDAASFDLHQTTTAQAHAWRDKRPRRRSSKRSEVHHENEDVFDGTTIHRESFTKEALNDKQGFKLDDLPRYDIIHGSREQANAGQKFWSAVKAEMGNKLEKGRGDAEYSEILAAMGGAHTVTVEALNAQRKASSDRTRRGSFAEASASDGVIPFERRTSYGEDHKWPNERDRLAPAKEPPSKIYRLIAHEAPTTGISDYRASFASP